MNEVKTWQTRCEDRRYTGAALTGSVVRDAMQAEIDELRALYTFATKSQSEWVAYMNTQLESVLTERDELRAKLDALEKQEPVAYFEGSRIDGQQDVTILKLIPAGSKLYLAAGASTQPDSELRTRLELMTTDRDKLARKVEELEFHRTHSFVQPSHAAQPLRELSDAEIQAAIDSVHTYTGDYANAIARAVLAAAGSKT